jgi:MFS family permease
MGATGRHFAVIFSIFTIAKLILSPWIGFCSDRVGRRSFIAIGLGLYVCVVLLYPLPTKRAFVDCSQIPSGRRSPFSW